MGDTTIQIGTRAPVVSPVDRVSTIKCEILAIKDNGNTLYVHYIGLNRRYDNWIALSELITTNPADIEPPKKKKKEEKKSDAEVVRANKIIGDELSVKNISKIYIRDYEVETWYFSPYPKEVIRNGTVYICEFCLYYFASKEQLTLHAHSCDLRHPPGTQIYIDGDLSFFELDGHIQKNYCRNISLLSKLFLDHKSLYYDVDVFMFYVLCRRDEYGYQVVGYFSKEKISEQGYNLACILTLPYEQRKGYGKILIDFSYLLSRKDRRIAGPEKPLSDLGLLSYRAYWLEIILEELSKNRATSIQAISRSSYIAEEDILGALIANKMLKYYGDEIIIGLSDEMHQKMLRGRAHKVNPKSLLIDY